MFARVDNEADKQGHFKDQMRAFDRWKAEVAHAIEEYKQWLDVHRMSTPEIELRIYDSLNSLRGDRLVIAFVAEFSRGKTELINAIFFSDYPRRLLPSDPGRTSKCPTELFNDQARAETYLRPPPPAPRP